MEVKVTDFKDTMLWTFEQCKEQALCIWSLNIAFDALVFPCLVTEFYRATDFKDLLLWTFENCRGQVPDVGPLFH
eukprot:13053841-Alexandrium_andersonii.AAC.1